jgi:hypothetical protein
VAKSTRANHLKTKKHINALTGNDKEYKYDPATRAKLRENYQAFVTKQKATLGENEFREKERLRKATYRLKLKKAREEVERKEEKEREKASRIVEFKQREQSIREQEKDLKASEALIDKEQKLLTRRAQVDSQLSQISSQKPKPKPNRKKKAPSARNNKRFKKDECNTALDLLEETLNLSNKSSVQYLAQLKSLYKKMFNKPFDCVTDAWMKNAQGTIKFIENKDTFKGRSISNNTKKARYEALVGWIKTKHFRESTAWEFAETQYNKAMIRYAEISDEKRGDNELSDKQKESYIPYPELLKMFIKKHKQLPIENRLVCALYLLLPPRRLEAYERMRVSNTKEKRKENWLIVHRKPPTRAKKGNIKPVKIVLNHYKTRDKYESQQIELMNPKLIRDVGYVFPRGLLSEIITQYVTSKRLSDNQYVFSPNKKRFDTPYKETDFSRLIVESFKKLTDKESIGSTLLRRVYATQLYKENLSTNDHTAIAKLMGHSYKENLKYRIV